MGQEIEVSGTHLPPLPSLGISAKQDAGGGVRWPGRWPGEPQPSPVLTCVP